MSWLTDSSRSRTISWGELQKLSDDELFRELISGGDDAFAVIVDRYQRLVFSVALRIVKDEGEAEDLVQVVFADIFKKMEQFDPARGTLKVWLLQYAYSRSINRRHYLEQRQFYSRAELDEVIALGYTMGATRSAGLSTAEVSRLVSQALGSLSQKQQRAITLVYFQGLTLDEAAGRTGETLPTIRHHYYRGLMKLRDFISSGKSLKQSEISESEEARPLEVGHLKPRPI
jgi:RNA polymerase sigma-70 factor (ECF subfamily)